MRRYWKEGGRCKVLGVNVRIRVGDGVSGSWVQGAVGCWYNGARFGVNLLYATVELDNPVTLQQHIDDIFKRIQLTASISDCLRSTS